MDPITIGIAVAAFVIGHIGVVPKLLGIPRPTGVGQGQVVEYLQKILNLLGSSPTPVPVSPVSPSTVDVNTLLTQLIALLEKAHAPATPVTPK